MAKYVKTTIIHINLAQRTKWPSFASDDLKF